MSTKMPGDGLPKHKDFLRAGLPRPHLLRNELGSISDIASFVSAPLETNVYGRVSNTLTVVDEGGTPVLVVFRRSDAFLTSPSTQDFFTRVIGEVTRTANGVLSYRSAGTTADIHERRRSVALTSTSRLATFDLSVAVKGLDVSLFESRDALFMSAALEVDLALLLVTNVRKSGSVDWNYGWAQWTDTTPTPLDAQVLGTYYELAQKAQLFNGSILDRVDLLCAATAIVYESPMYTTRPEDYEGLGVRVIEYGAVRNKAAAKEQDARRERRAAEAAQMREGYAKTKAAEQARLAGPKPPYLDPSSDAADQAFRTLFHKGEPFGDNAVTALVKAATVGNDLTGAIADILDEADGDDTSWRLGLLGMAPQYDGALNPTSAYRGNLVISAGNILNTVHGDDDDSLRIRELAFLAQAAWGTWPDDAADEIFYELEEEPTDPKLLDYYRSYMLMAGISGEVADHELDEIRAGRVQPTRARIEELRAN